MTHQLENRRATMLGLDSPACETGKVLVERISYHGWPDCYRIANGCVEAIVVPAVGRLMQFRLAGDEDGAFWENRALDGLLHDSNSSVWLNFGGDKSWPAPQSAWSGQQGLDWPPPAGFDSRPMEPAPTDRGVVLTSSVDPAYGIQVVRTVELAPEQPRMRIKTEFRKVRGNAVRVGIWTITQMRDPERIYMLLPEKPSLANRYVRLLEGEPSDLRIDGRLLSLERHPLEFVKLGSQATSLAWVGGNCVVRIDAEEKLGEYPDGGCATEIYTNPGPLAYVELETLGPLETLHEGERLGQTALYTIMRRTVESPDAEAQRLWE